MLIIPKKDHQIKRVLKYFCLLSVIFSILLSPPHIPKYWEYSERSGTIRRIEAKRSNPYWSIAKKLVKEFCIWLFLAGIIAVLFDSFGLWGAHIGWIMMMLGLRKCLLSLAIMGYDFPLFRETLLKIAQGLETIVWTGTI